VRYSCRAPGVHLCCPAQM